MNQANQNKSDSNSEPVSPPHFHTRGVSSFNRSASTINRTFSLVFDSFFVFMVGMIAFQVSNKIVLPNLYVGLLIVFSTLSYHLLQKYFFGITLGERVWHIKTARQSVGLTYPRVLCQKDHIDRFEQIQSAVLTLLTCSVAFYELSQNLFKNPIWIESGTWTLDSFVPSPIPKHEWMVMPFFYQIGAWPTEFQNQPIFYSLSYEKGPPKRFIGHVTLHLQDPDIQIIIEGPKTPTHTAARSELRDCISQNFRSYQCLALRFQTLERHILEIQPLNPVQWNLQWFTVASSGLNPDVNQENPAQPSALTPEEQTQGIYLKAAGPNGSWIQDRFILMNAQSTHQTIILNRTDTPAGIQAYEALLKTVRSSRTFQDLDAGRAWIDRELETVHLEEIQSIQDPNELMARLAQIQSLLISKISVEPASFDSYYHLAGTSFLLATSPKLKTVAPLSNSPTHLTASENLRSAYRFALDIRPDDPRNTQIENMILGAKKP